MGDVDGVNRDFQTISDFAASSLHVYVNGQLRSAVLDGGWDETGPHNFKLKEAPLPGDVIQVAYRPI